jgi:colanic acid/amylovoran biosynthesis protein
MSGTGGIRRILLVNACCHENTGDAARQLSVIKSLLYHIPGAELTVVTQDHINLLKGNGRVKIIRNALPSASSPLRLDVLRVPALVRAYFGADLVVSVGGVIGHISSLLPLSLGIMLGKRTVIYSASTSGPFRNRLYAFLAKQILGRTTLITLREEISRKHLEKLKLTKPQIHTTADIAFLLDVADKQKVDRILSENGIPEKDGPMVGVNISRCPNSNRETHERYLEVMAKLVDYLIVEIGATVVLLPFCYMKGYDDRLEIARVRRLTGDKAKMKIIAGKLEPEELKGVIGRMGLFVGTRGHSNILALSMCVPTLAISYHHKMDGIMKAMGMSEWVCSQERLNSYVLIGKASKMWALKDDIKDKLNKKMPIIEEKALLNSKLIGQLLHSFADEKKQRGAYSENGLYTDAN